MEIRKLEAENKELGDRNRKLEGKLGEEGDRMADRVRQLEEQLEALKKELED